jgi:hypothetical protein
LKARSDGSAHGHETAKQPQGNEHGQARVEAETTETLPIRIFYNTIRHATGKYGQVRICALEITQEGDTVVVRPVNSRNQPLQSAIELPRVPEVLRDVAGVLEQLATEAEAERAALRKRMQAIAEAGENGRTTEHLP